MFLNRNFLCVCFAFAFVFAPPRPASPFCSPRAQKLLRTPLFAFHGELGAKMVPFAGWEMPVQYPAGVLKEHFHTRSVRRGIDVFLCVNLTAHFCNDKPIKQRKRISRRKLTI